MPYLSNLQQLITAAVFGYSGKPDSSLTCSSSGISPHLFAGYGLIFHTSRTLAQLSPFLNLIEQRTSLKRYSGTEDGLIFFGIGLLSMSYFYLMGVYTNDEKFKRNSSESSFFDS